MNVSNVAQIIHAANREVQKLIGETVNPEWDDAEDWMKQSTISGVLGVYNGNTPEMSHEAWIQTRLADGWVWGEVKDMELKTHPCLVPYNQLPPLQRIKDSLFGNIANTFKDMVE